MTIYVPSRPKDYYMEVARGNIPGHVAVAVQGDNPDVDGPEDVWSQGATWVAPVAATKHNVVSSSTADDSTGTGLRTALFYGLDADWNIASETITMDGTTNVLTTKSYSRQNGLIGLTFGSGGLNAGTVTSTTADAATTVTTGMPIGKGRAMSAIYSVPLGKTLYIVAFGGALVKTAAAGTAAVEIDLQVRLNADTDTAGWITVVEGGEQTTGTSTENFVLPFPAVVAAKSDVKLRVSLASTTNIDFAGRFNGIQIDDGAD